ncbi:MAG TPA: cupredoxin domain-containing protein [Burkholderiales bacterium]|jgi:cytochrome c oxidase subunit 2|nr:cupredoxin domain-containing protein [Burkholderiales bacterium]
MIFAKKASRIIAAALVATLGSLGAYVVAQSAEPKEKVIKITAKKFNYTPGTVTLKKGVPVILEFRTQDVLMGFNLPDFNARADIVPGKTTRLRLVPDKTGTFVFLCDVFCGTGHEEMNGKLTVVD